MSASFKDLRVWQEAMRFVTEVYQATMQFPRYELYGLSNQLRRAAVSIPSNSANAINDRIRITISGQRRSRAIGNRRRLDRPEPQ
jgi:23S rRNA-intervening sequence protein